MEADLLSRPAALQTRLEQRPLLQLLFNGGVWVAGADGTAIADVPLSANRIGINYMEMDFIATTLKEGKSTVGRPVMGKKLEAPIFAMTVPMHDAQRKVVGVIVGVTNLGKHSFLDKITQNPYGKTGGYVLISAKHRLVVTATDKSRVMEPLPAPGVNAWVDRFANGYESWTVAANPKGVEVLVSGKVIPVAEWYVLASLPTAEAFAPVRDLQQRLLWTTLLLTVLVGALTWWVLKRQLAPLVATADAMAALADSAQTQQPLALTHSGEIGQLVASFNRILQTWTQREVALLQRKIMLERSESMARLASFEWDVDTNTVTWSPEMFRLFGRDPALGIPNLEGQAELYTPATTQMLFEAVSKAVSDGTPYTIELMTVQPDGEQRPCIAKGFPERDGSGRVVRVAGLVQDITVQKQAQAALIASEERWKFAIEGAGDGLWDWNIQTGKAFYSPRYKTMLGFAEEEIGDTADEWSKRIHPEDAPGVYAALQPYMDGKPGSATVEFRMLCKDGSWMWTLGRGMVVQRDANGNALRMIGTNSDITSRKLTEANLQLAANVFSHAREGITITNASGIILDVNEAFTRITGYSREESIGQNPRILKSGRQDKALYVAMWDALTGPGHWSGEVWNRRKNGEAYAELLTISAVRDAQGNTQQYVALFSDITGIKEHQTQLEHIAHFDALTSLPNRVLLGDRLRQAMSHAQRREQQLAVAYLDLDGFKAINDHHGHEAGDHMLIALAQRMKQALREGDTLARLGGDEFVAVLVDLEDTADSLTLLTRLLASAAQTVQMGELTLQVSASLGVTFYPQLQDIDADQLLRQADQAMYQAKVAGKNRHHVFDAAQDSSIRDQHENLERIRLALEQSELVLHYQPKVNMRSGKVIGAEALIRWQHPDKGLLAPATFLPVIEDHPLAVEVGEWVIDTAMHQMEAWHAVEFDLPVSINVGARQLQQGDFVERLQAILAKHPQVHPDCLEIEVLETSALSDMALVSQVIEDCAKIGVKFALDDFGTGYSSLTYLKRLRVALLKIDQSFVRDMLDDPDDLAILDGVIGLATAFNRQVIAEGVETVEHGTLLLQLGCELAQGYGIARPMPPEQLPAWAATWQPDAAWCVLPWLGGDDPGTDW
jgi:diguanylate cyclase (GGDEF)-like protein/PAS domain S-box-containing protein